ncbi:hypothetical protein N0V95_007043 [Ascochyta clinopodiicola]|nr:hypothetical protein N0V95_007043 [Ascochyta clinopodiicola]
MLGKIALEEAYEVAGNNEKSMREAKLYIHPNDRERYIRQIHDIKDERVRLADEHGIGYTIVSLTVPGIQGIADRVEAERKATEINNWAAEQIKKHPRKLGAFACLSMHNPSQAAEELRRCVKEFGFHGALLCNFQHAGNNGETYLFYDQPEYDAFWKVCQELDVPVYIHPSAPTDIVYEKLLHLMGLITNGVFDRNPNLKIIVGHLGEHIPFDFWRINHWLEDVERPLAHEQSVENFAKRSIYDYFKKNI